MSGQLVTITGTNFGDEPTILFPVEGGQTQVSFGFFEEEALIVRVPEGLVDGAIRIDNGQGPGNGYQAKSLFSPTLELQLGETEGDFTLHFSQTDNLYPMQAFDVYLWIDDATLQDLSVEEMVGTLDQRGSAENLFVEEANETSAVLQVAVDTETDPSGHVRLEVIDEEPKLLRIRYEPSFFSTTIDLLNGPGVVDVALTGLPVTLLSDSGIVVSGSAESGATSIDGRDSAFTSPVLDALPGN